MNNFFKKKLDTLSATL